MNRFLTITLVAIIGQTVLSFSIAQDSTTSKWHSRYTAAVEEAKAQNKDLLIVFTGSNWIDICKTFEKDILMQPDFIDPVSQKYSLLKLEFPKDNRLPAALASEYQLLKTAYRVRGFPTVLVTDSAGLPFGLNGYQPITAENYARTMLAMVKGREIRDAATNRAASLKGAKKVDALVESVPELPGSLAARYYRKEMEEVINLDPKNKSGRADHFKKMLADVDYSSEMQRLAEQVQYEKMIELTDSYIKEQNLSGELLQRTLMDKLSVLRKQKNTEGVVRTLLEVVSVEPKSQFGKSAQKMLDQLRAQKIQQTLAK